MDQEAQKARNRQAGEQVQQGVFGGSRAAVANTELDKNLSDIKSRRIFEDLSKNFMQAQDKLLVQVNQQEQDNNKQLHNMVH